MAKNMKNALSGKVSNSNRIKGEVIRYGIAGAINTFVGFAIYSAAIKFFSAPYWLANFLAIVAGTICGFTLARFFVFKSLALNISKNAWKYVATILLQYLISTVLIGIIIHFGFNEIVSYLWALPMVIALSFVLQKYWVFGNSTETPSHEL